MAMTTVDTDRAERGRRVFADVMTFPPPEDAAPATTNMLDFVFAEVWERPGLSRRDRRFITLPCVAAADAETPLRDHVYAALNSGDLTITEMREAVLAFRGVQRLAQGISVQHGCRRTMGTDTHRARRDGAAARCTTATGDFE